MIDLIAHEAIDMVKWDKMIRNSSHPLVFAESFYLNATSPGWSALVSGNYDSGMPITAGKKAGISYFMQPPFTSQLGVFGNYQQAQVQNYLTIAKEHFSYIAIELNAGNILTGKDAGIRRTFVLPAVEKSACNENTKRNIARAKKNEIIVRSCSLLEELQWSEKYIQPFLKNELKLGLKERSRFRSLIRSASECQHLKSWVALNENQKICAFAHFVSNGKHALYLKGVNLDKNSGAMHLLMEEAIQHYRKHASWQFDFGGGKSENLATFFRGFGAKELNYPTWKLNALPFPLKLLKR